MDITLRHLRHVVAIDELATFSEAADATRVTQSALSKSILSLENELGLRIFERRRTGAIPTAIGRAFIQDARRLLGQVDDLTLRIKQLAGAESGRVVFGMAPSIADLLLVPVITACAKERPGLHVKAVVRAPQELEIALLRGEVECYFCSNLAISRSRQTDWEPLTSHEWAFYARAEHPLGNAPIRLEDLRDFPLATGLLNRRSTLEGRCAPWNVSPSIECDDYGSLRQAALNSDLVLLSTCHGKLSHDLEDGLLRQLEVSDAVLERSQICLVKEAGHSLSPAAEWLAQMVRQQGTPA